jgi:hypothetical protein
MVERIIRIGRVHRFERVKRAVKNQSFGDVGCKDLPFPVKGLKDPDVDLIQYCSGGPFLWYLDMMTSEELNRRIYHQGLFHEKLPLNVLGSLMFFAPFHPAISIHGGSCLDGLFTTNSKFLSIQDAIVHRKRVQRI